jgi:hypothetical protein
MYLNNPNKKKTGFRLVLFDSLGELEKLRGDILQFLSLDDSENIRLNPADGKYRKGLVLDNGLPEETGQQKYLELMDYIVNLFRSGPA